MHQNEFTTRTHDLRHRLYRTALLTLGDESAALDAVDESVYKALRSLKQLREPAFFETWLFRILINECRRELKRRKRLIPEANLPELSGDDPSLEHLPLKEALRHLPAELRDILVLRFFADCTLSQTAEALGLPHGTVVTRQRRALRILRMELEEEDLP